MGNFYTNITIRCGRHEVTPILSALRRSAWVGEFDGLSVICDRECEKQDLDILASLAMTLSTRLERAALAVLNHDDDVLLFGLYQSGALVSERGRSKMSGVPAPSTHKGDFVRAVRSAMGTTARPYAVQGSMWLTFLTRRRADARRGSAGTP